MKVFGISIDGWSVSQVLEAVERAKEPLWVVTANPEILLEARRDPAYAQALKQADLRTVDGMGLYLFGRARGQSWQRVTGVELGEACLKKAETHKWKVAFIGGSAGVAESVAKKWQKIFPALVMTHEQGGIVQKNGEDNERGEEARHRLTLFSPDIIFVAFGHPKQERWIARYISDFPKAKLIIGVGGAFDYWSGMIMRAPSLIRALGLEWLWRVLRQPWRIGRIIRAVIIFPVLALFSALRHSE